jgi:hypothetical protein
LVDNCPQILTFQERESEKAIDEVTAMFGEWLAGLTLKATRWGIRNAVAFGRTIVQEAPIEGEKLAAELAKLFNRAPSRRQGSSHASKQPTSGAGVRGIEPAFFAWGERYVVAVHSDGTYALPDGTFPGTATRPAKPGEIIALLGKDLGSIDTQPSAPAGLSEGTYNINANFHLRLDQVPVRVLDIVPASELAGVCRVTVQVPETARGGDLRLQGDVYGVALPDNVFLAVTDAK